MPASSTADSSSEPVHGATAPQNMAWVAGRRFQMGCERFYPEEQPLHDEDVEGFWIDRHPVTVRDFRRFVADSDYVTVAERPLAPGDYPDADPELLVPGSLVFQQPPGPVSLEDYRAWWAYVPGACWRHPLGPGSETRGRGRHPVVHIAYEDACAYAEWAGKSLPGEAEWELAARGGLDGKLFTWGDEELPGGRLMANTWQGRFPWQNLGANGHLGTSPVGSFASNDYGLFDMAGNVWEWTSDLYAPYAAAGGEDGASAAPHEATRSPCCGPAEPGEPAGERFPRRVIKGGSHLCAPNYCLRFRPAARQGETVDTSTSHIGFRCIVRAAQRRLTPAR